MYTPRPERDRLDVVGATDGCVGLSLKKALLIPSPGFLQECGIVMWPWDFWKSWKIRGGIQNLERKREIERKITFPGELVVVRDWGFKCSYCKIRFVNPWTVLWVSGSCSVRKNIFHVCACMHGPECAYMCLCIYWAQVWRVCVCVCVCVCVPVCLCALLLNIYGLGDCNWERPVCNWLSLNKYV